MSQSFSKSTRRDLFRLASVAGAGLAAQNIRAAGAASMSGVPFDKREKVRIGVIGVGGRGTGQLRNFVAVDGVEVVGLCDIVQEKVERAGQMVVKSGQEKVPTLYWKGDHAFEELNRREDVDLLVVATPWNWHVPMAIDAMKQGKHTTIEVPAATTIDE